MKKLNHKGFSPLHILLLIVIVGMVGGVGYYVYNSQKKTNTTLDNAAKSQGEPQKTTTKTAAEIVSNSDKNEVYLVVKEWGVKLPESNSSVIGATYQVNQSVHEGVDSISISTAKVTSFKCSPVDGSGVDADKTQPYEGGVGALYRSKDASKLDGLTLEPASSYVKVDSYFYVFQGATGTGSCQLSNTDGQLLANASETFRASWQKMMKI